MPGPLWGQSASEEFFLAVVDFVQRHGSVHGLVMRMEQMNLSPRDLVRYLSQPLPRVLNRLVSVEEPHLTP
jgi:hypothetical protein